MLLRPWDSEERTSSGGYTASLTLLSGLFHEGTEAGAAALVDVAGDRPPPFIEGGATARQAHAHSIRIFDPGSEPVRRRGRYHRNVHIHGSFDQPDQATS